MKYIAVVAIAGALMGCVTPPQTTEEVREGVRQGAAMAKVENAKVNRAFSAVFRDIQANADRCLNVTVTGSTPGRYGPHVESSRYRASSKMTGRRTGETVLQLDDRATGKMPVGGYFVMVVDTEGLSASQTRLTMYGPSLGYDNVYESFHAWGKGNKHGCPKFPMGGLGQSFTYHSK